MEVYERIEIIRQILKITKRELAKKANINEQYLYQILSGKKKLNKLDKLQNIAKALDVNVSVLLGEKEMFPHIRPMPVYKPLYMSKNAVIGNNIKFFRLQKDLTEEQLAKELGIDRTYLSKLETGKHVPSPKNIYKVCKFFHKELGEMFYIIWDNDM